MLKRSNETNYTSEFVDGVLDNSLAATAAHPHFQLHRLQTHPTNTSRGSLIFPRLNDTRIADSPLHKSINYAGLFLLITKVYIPEFVPFDLN